MEEMNITINELGRWVRDNAPYSPRFLNLDLEDGRRITWELEPRTGVYNLVKKEKN